MELFSVAGKLALVTGSSRGLGQALALALAEAGARVIVHGRDAEAVERSRQLVAEKSEHPVHTVLVDVTDADAVEAAVADLVETVGVPDILVNNAGLQRRAPFAEFDVADWDAIVAANLSGVFYVSRFLAPAMIARGSGKIVNIGSVQSLLARQTIAPYSATKGSVVQLTRGMAADLARHNIQVNAISPGYFATEMNTALVGDPAFNEWLVNRTPAHRWGSFDELRGALIFLSSDASSFVSGQNIFVDGGMTAVV
ncbi:glucose 1-dehydrogenase [Mycetocola reblochoni]|uniref:5-keto-D-gluconate 5-reductase n=2 Tax=Mycetocola reblochoni TaxID=331618 RepID=A0A1R4KCJ3_9MICO|nr:glucose 1-dehydrogenase [Mycetocola reblochoni]RLP69275.1 glucose 1-dehydrogenase [Mycetocola reblochoni]SJN42030.1 5-keto-D-gluconate 5-reductase [Mycetocola reblochoni REB411]